jgi:MoxR-like ATPase
VGSVKVSLRNDGLMLSPEPWPSKEDNVVILPEEVSHEVSRNVIDHINAASLLVASGLGAQRGVLLYGPPGTGKTSIIKSTIAKVRDKVTVLVPDSRAASNALETSPIFLTL